MWAGSRDIVDNKIAAGSVGKDLRRVTDTLVETATTTERTVEKKVCYVVACVCRCMCKQHLQYSLQSKVAQATCAQTNIA